MKDIYGVMYCDYPIGKIVEFGTNVDPNTLYPGTKWTRFAPGQVTVGYNASDDDFNNIGETGGEKTHTLTVEQLPEHKLRLSSLGYGGESTSGDLYTVGFGRYGYREINTDSIGGNQPHSNMQPYIVVSKWIRNS